jgi:hypothetical protein
MRHYTLSTVPLLLTGWVVCAVLNPCSAQVTFERTYGGSGGESGRCVQQTLDGGYVIVGTTLSFGSGYDIYLVKTDSLGDTLWTRVFDRGLGDFGWWVEETPEEGYVVGGTSRSAETWNDFYLAKVDPLGDILWEMTYGDSTDQDAYCLQQTSDGGYVMVGTTVSDIYLLKTDSLGNTLWDRAYGGSRDDAGYSVRQTPDGGYIIVGETWPSSVDTSDIFIIKTDSLGNAHWTKRYGGIHDDGGSSVDLAADGGYIITGATYSFGADNSDVYLIKIDSLGDSVWARTYGGTNNDHGRSVQVTRDGGYIIAGTTHSFGEGIQDFYLLKTDSLGNLLWTKTYGGTSDDRASSVRQTTDGGYIIVGQTHSFGAGSDDVYLVKTNGNGEVGVAEEDPRVQVEPEGIFLQQNTPNPFAHLTLISYSLPHASEVHLTIYDITGRLVETLVNETQRPGIHQVSWNRRNNPSGVYFYRLKAGEFTQTGKMVVLE